MAESPKPADDVTTAAGSELRLQMQRIPDRCRTRWESVSACSCREVEQPRSDAVSDLCQRRTCHRSYQIEDAWRIDLRVRSHRLSCAALLLQAKTPLSSMPARRDEISPGLFSRPRQSVVPAPVSTLIYFWSACHGCGAVTRIVTANAC